MPFTINRLKLAFRQLQFVILSKAISRKIFRGLQPQSNCQTLLQRGLRVSFLAPIRAVSPRGSEKAPKPLHSFCIAPVRQTGPLVWKWLHRWPCKGNRAWLRPVPPLHQGRENGCNTSPCKLVGPGEAPWLLEEPRRQMGHGSWYKETQSWTTTEKERGLWVLHGQRGSAQIHIRGGKPDSHTSKNGQRNYCHQAGSSSSRKALSEKERKVGAAADVRKVPELRV